MIKVCHLSSAGRKGCLCLAVVGGACLVQGQTVDTAAVEKEKDRGFSLAPSAVGVRGAIPGDQKAEHFYQAEGYGRWELPWDWTLGERWTVRTWGDISAGYLTDEKDDGFVGTAGPVVTLQFEDFPVAFEGGCSPTFLSRHEFRHGEFGIWFQFTSHAGLRWHINDHLSLAYRFQHMSNAGLDDRNPGLDMHSFAVGYDF